MKFSNPVFLGSGNRNKVRPEEIILVQDEFFADQDVIHIDTSLEGMTSDPESGRYYLGTWAGPEAKLSNLLHEMGHFVEREIDKLKEFPISNWGYSFGKYWELCGRSGWEPRTDQDVRREQRVWAYQISLEKHFGIYESPYEMVNAAPFLGGWCFYQPLEIETYENEPRIRKLAEETEELSRTRYTLERFRKGWWRRIRELSP